MASFDRDSNFNAEANFTGVKFGESKPVLETELNELQEIQNEARAEIVRDSIPSGFITLGELDYDYMLNNENCVKLKTDSVAYVNGYKIKIPKDTIIDIGKAPEKDAREDLLFLEVWKEEVTKDHILTKNGGDGQPQITNNIKDTRYPIETSRRYALRWRIRHVADVDFNIHGEDGLERISASYKDGHIHAQGALDTPVFPSSQCAWTTEFTKQTNDKGLYKTSNNYPPLTVGDLKTLDNQSYAIPMFRLYRKPSCGKAIPFEYQKMNPKVDYSKFTELMKEEKVERVVSEDIGGRSLVNLAKGTGIMGNVHANATITNLAFNKNTNGISATVSSVTTKPNYAMLGLTVVDFSHIVDPSKEYTLIFNSQGSIHPVEASYMVGDSTNRVLNNKFNAKSGINIIKMNVSPDFQTNIPSRRVFFLFDCDQIKVDEVLDIQDIMILEGDWTTKPLPEFFTDIKSLGENEGNLIEVKTGILNESSYDPSTGNAKLNTISGANYITSDNLLMSNIEAQVKRGDIKLSDLTEFGRLDNLVGDETVEFNKLKGKTIQNLHDGMNTYALYQAGITENVDYRLTTSDYYIKLERLTSVVPRYTYFKCGTVKKERLKPSTKYTVIFGKAINLSRVCLMEGNTDNPISDFSDIVNNKALITTVADINIGSGQIVYVLPNNYNTNTLFEVQNVMIVEGDWTNVDIDKIPYTNGILSVGEDTNNIINLKRPGKNLFNPLDYTIVGGSELTNPSVESIIATTVGDLNHKWIKVKLPVNNTYTITIDKRKTYDNNWANQIMESDSDSILVGGTYRKLFRGTNDTSKIDVCIIKTTKPYVYIHCGYGNKWETNKDELLSTLQIEFGEQSTTHEPFKECIQNITLKEPLRSLPNGVCDTIEGNKVIRRIGKVVLTGSSNENWRTYVNITSHIKFSCDLPRAISNTPEWGGSGICDKLVLTSLSASEEVESASIYAEPYKIRRIYISVNKSKLSTSDVVGFRTWLSQNPITVYYELASPIEEIIEPNYDKESVKTYQLDAPLRSLPNGIKDEIVGDKLIRRCGEIIFNGSEKWIKDTAQFYTFNDGEKFYKIGSQALSSNLNIECGTNYFPIIPLKKNSNIESKSVEEFKAMLNETPLKMIYELSTPIEIPLREVHSNISNFSLQRQFSEGNWLRELPNGVKDTVENGKVIRRTKKVILNGNESWIVEGQVGAKFCSTTLNSKDCKYSNLKISNILPNNIIGLTLSSNPVGFNIVENGDGSQSIRVKHLTTDVSSSQDIKDWLKTNNLEIIYELKTPTEETLSNDNYTYYPHHEINTYCGSLYVGNGTDDVFVENGLGNDEVIVDTPFRSIKNKAIITDCKYKKNIDGYDTQYTASKNKNILNFEHLKKADGTISIDYSEWNDSRYKTRIYMKDGDYTFYAKCSSARTWIRVKVSSENNTEVFAKSISTLNGVQCQFSIPSSGIYIVSVTANTPSDVGVVLTETQLEVGKSFTSYEPFIPTTRYLENTENNDIDDLRHKVSLTGFNYDKILNESFDKLLRGEL